MATGGATLPHWGSRQPGLGVAVILTNDYVGCPNIRWGPLPGTKEDHSAWKSALTHLFFKVESHTNLSKAETICLLHSVSTSELPAAAVKQHLVFVYCGHGVKDYIVCQDGQKLSTDEVCEPFLQHRCGTAVAKLLFFDACRGERRDKGMVFARSASMPDTVPQTAGRGGTSAQGQLMPSEGNYLVVFSTLPDHIAQELSGYSGSPSYGMWSQTFAPKLSMCNKPLSSLLAEVNLEMMWQCRELLSQPQSPPGAGFQVAEISKSTLIGDVNLLASARQLLQVLGRAPQMPSVTPPPPPASQSRSNYRHKFNNEFKQRLKLNVREEPSQVEGGYIFRLSVEWEKRWYTMPSQCHPTREEAKEEACRLMVETLEKLTANSQDSEPSAQPLDRPVAPPFNQSATLPTGWPVAPPFNQPVAPPFNQPVAPPFNQPVTPPFNQPVALPFNQPVTPPFNQPVAPPFNQPVTPPTGRPVVLSGSKPVMHELATPVPRPPAVPLVMSRGGKKYQEILNECRQKVVNAGGRWSLTGEPENVAQSTFECQLTLEVTPSAGATPLQLESERVRVVGKKYESRERAAQDLVGRLQTMRVLQLN